MTRQGCPSWSTTSKTGTALGCSRRAVMRASRIARWCATSASALRKFGQRAQLLDRDGPAQPLVPGQPHVPHATRPDAVLQSVATCQQVPLLTHVSCSSSLDLPSRPEHVPSGRAIAPSRRSPPPAYGVVYRGCHVQPALVGEPRGEADPRGAGAWRLRQPAGGRQAARPQRLGRPGLVAQALRRTREPRPRWCAAGGAGAAEGGGGLSGVARRRAHGGQRARDHRGLQQAGPRRPAAPRRGQPAADDRQDARRRRHGRQWRSLRAEVEEREREVRAQRQAIELAEQRQRDARPPWWRRLLSRG